MTVPSGATNARAAYGATTGQPGTGDAATARAYVAARAATAPTIAARTTKRGRRRPDGAPDATAHSRSGRAAMRATLSTRAPSTCCTWSLRARSAGRTRRIGRTVAIGYGEPVSGVVARV